MTMIMMHCGNILYPRKEHESNEACSVHHKNIVLSNLLLKFILNVLWLVAKMRGRICKAPFVG